MPTLLAIDTATEACSVALLHEGSVMCRYEVIPRMHAQKVLPMIQELMAESEIALSAVDAIAFGRGPGAFTGVRIAIGVVQGLAFGLDRPVLPVSNLAALAQRAYRERGVNQVAAAIDARMDEVYWGCYRLEQEVMQLTGAEAVLPPEQVYLPETATGEWFGAGTGWSYVGRMVVPVTETDSNLLPHAKDILTLAVPAWTRGDAVPAEEAQPVYLRDQVATPKQSR
ncbi:tRNA (adenosine(37)-N6)-threonylcarbamoyltransferase complex dimerization subunit type 1 TsaB [Pseudomonas asuensis]|uniref:tRNA threonylcarbamoyladenosine biosynthesis protein TsaB n=1 Tax=Pseudomonas asuensis TaxID=1825787 RepID=A0ABQ2GEZ0_9PSED|nr:tRNA (adenosine(37)-N6)-threonylcarbamoyltransferase complex dimerization subunit type 1 TsaB [Pseudomonas asuensis]GGL93132.1 tRNA (adenosine(37)-N6)-threonylcarbamoyltransferase complex dimerization subunit type 1 TsaB [Pseudomonas asuensis]